MLLPGIGSRKAAPAENVVGGILPIVGEEAKWNELFFGLKTRRS